MALQGLRLLHFVVFGTAPRHGLVAVARRRRAGARASRSDDAAVELRDVPRPVARSAAAGGARSSCCT